MFKIPFSFLPTKNLRRLSHLFLGVGQNLSHLFPFLGATIKNAQMEIDSREYLSMCFISNVMFFFFISAFMFIFLRAFGVADIKVVLLISFFFTMFAFMEQLIYPKLIVKRRVKDIERNLLPATQNILVQLNSGIPIFEIFVNISKSNYGEISKEFFTTVKEINSGKPQIDAIEELATSNPSLYFRRAIWQLVNGMKSGADLTDVIKDVINSLSEDQVIQIQRYGSQLNPLAMFYMLIAVIAPALGMTFLIILSSFISLSSYATKLVFWGFYGGVLFMQVMFLGIIRSRRPNLLGDN